jgi:hypothetical protein
MNFVMLITHGLSAISVHGETLGVRLLISSALISMFFVIVLALVLFQKFVTGEAILGWTSMMVLMIVVIFIQMISTSFVFAFITLNSRNNINFLPIRDYAYFVQRIERIPGSSDLDMEKST